ncbi:MAG: HU family DNA-binding protein [Bacteroidales bacterium]|nr:HU family DNA-binding protein [Bacteroidales bacterium]MCQ2256147.1 HU family DNA-binding protein [Bacteroidaceae bacterium]
MNKTQLVEAVAAKANLTQKDTKAVLDAFYATVAEQAAKSEPIVITGFGSFSVSERAAKEGRNPATGEKMTIPAKKVVKFKPGKDLAL